MKKLLLVADVKGWAFHYMAQGIAKYAPPEYDVQVIDNLEFGQYTTFTPGALMDFDGICQFGWTESTTPGKNGVHWNYATAVVASHGLEFPWPIRDKSYLPHRIATQLRNSQSASERLPQFDRVICVSPKLRELASRYNRESVFCMPGVDDEVFYPTPNPQYAELPPSGLDQSTREGREELARRAIKPIQFPVPKLRIGWCGQRRGVTKGYNEVLLPLMESLGSEQYEWWINDRDQSDALPQSKMAEWYRTLDVFINTSFSEGCSQTILEAIASGLPVVATYCGMAKESGAITVPTYGSGESAIGTVRAFETTLRELPERPSLPGITWRENAARWCAAVAGEDVEE